MKRPAACSKQRPSACTMKKLPKPKRSRSKAALQEKKAALQRQRNCDKNLRWRVRNAQKEGTEINPRLTRNRTIAAQVIHLEKKHRHLEKKQNDLEEKHLVLEQEQTRCISLTEKANHDFCRVQDHSLEAQAMATQALDDASTNRDEMKRIQSIQDQHESILHGFQAYLQDNAVQLSRHNALPLSTTQHHRFSKRLRNYQNRAKTHHECRSPTVRRGSRVMSTAFIRRLPRPTRRLPMRSNSTQITNTD